ncbi:MAG: hypothetical protein JWR10_1374, partial [Rubritepida sp.]|nr:hypothetical protein [Rubritepida sp.]
MRGQGPHRSAHCTKLQGAPNSPMPPTPDLRSAIFLDFDNLVSG